VALQMLLQILGQCGNEGKGRRCQYRRCKAESP
jgi:hypothetical protein